jgi:hypothetical protein
MDFANCHPLPNMQNGCSVQCTWSCHTNLGHNAGAHCFTPLQETLPLRDTDCNVTVCASVVTAGQRKHVLMAFVITDSAGSNKARHPGSGTFKVADLPQPSLHWGCINAQGDRWQEPPPGWSTWPDVSHDARECCQAWIGSGVTTRSCGVASCKWTQLCCINFIAWKSACGCIHAAFSHVTASSPPVTADAVIGGSGMVGLYCQCWLQC